jgi:hypothetical protein
MEEEVLKLLNKNNYPHADFDDDVLCAKDIVGMIEKFTAWKDDPQNVEYDDGVYWVFDRGSNKGLSLNQLFKYWLTDVIDE